MYTEDDLIVVDDEPAQEAPQASPQNVVGTTWFYEEPQTIAQSVMRQTRSKRASEDTPFVPRSERSTRSSMAGPKLRPKLKLKLSEKAGMVTGTSFLGNYDRELDSEDEDLTFEEQFILRMPPGEDCEKLRKMVAAREADPDVWFKFKGMFGLHYIQNANLTMSRSRFTTSSVPHWKYIILCKVS